MSEGTWTNADGLVVKFPAYYRDGKHFVNRARVVSTMGPRYVMEVDFDLSQIPAGTTSYAFDLNNDGTVDGWSDEDPSIPANASVTEAVLVMEDAAAGGTSFTVGTYRQDGTAVSANSLVTATEGVLANVNAAGKRVYGAGALTATTAGTAGVGAHNVYVGITTTGTFTAGKGKLYVTYLVPTPAAASNT